MSGGREASGVTGGQAVAGSGSLELGCDGDGSLGGGTGGGVGGDGQDGDKD